MEKYGIMGKGVIVTHLNMMLVHEAYLIRSGMPRPLKT